MSVTWKTARVFISSTFRDMHAERDHLVKVVFPDLRERLEKHRIHLVDIDLRWGVTAEQSDNDLTLDLCLDEIKRSRPFFIGIVGQRYGWVPKKLPEAALKKYGWIQGMTGRSITELEILHGVLNDPKMRSHAMFFFRKDDFIASVPKELKDRVYLDEYAEKLSAVKEDIRRHCRNSGAPLREYPCNWDSQKPNSEDDTQGRIVGLEEFGELVKKDLLDAMAREYPWILKPAPAAAVAGTEDWLEEEQDFHERFIESRLQVYVGRENIHRQLMDYLEGASTGPLLLSGGSGTGKSSILGKLWENWREDHADDFALPHFVGASPTSTDIRITLRRFCLALREKFKLTQTVKREQGEPETMPREVPEEMEKLPDAFREFLKAVPENGRAVLIIDAVNQLDEFGGAQEMAWLPEELSPHVKIIVSCIDEPGKEQTALNAMRKRNTQELKVEPLTNAERFEIVSQVPSISAKSLDPKQIALLLENPATTNPLYLVVALEELRGFGSFEKLTGRIRSFPRVAGEKGLDELFLQVIERLEKEIGQGTVCSALASIASSRTGLAEQELSEILKQIGAGKEAQHDCSGEMLVMLRQLRPYLLRRGRYVDFYHRNLFKAVRHRYLSKEDIRAGFQRALAEYFNGKGLASERMLSETPHHMREAGMWEKLEELLTDLRFVEAKCAAGMTFELVRDYNAALEALPEMQEERQKRDENGKRIDKYTKDLIAFSKGEIPTLEIIPSIRSYTDEEIDADAARILNNPSRLDRMKAFSQFVNSESHALVKFGSMPAFCIQHAYNCVDSGPVGRAAESLVNSEADKAMILHAPFHRLKYNPHPALLRTLEGHKGHVSSISVTPDGKRAVSSSVDFSLRVWDLESGHCLRTLADTVCASSLSVTPDGKRAVSGSKDHTLRVWDLESGCCLRILEGHTESVNSVSVTPDGKRAVSGSKDNTLRVWDLESGCCLRILEGHTEGVNSVSVTPDGKKAVSGSSDNTLRVWDLKTGRCLRILEGHIFIIDSVSITPDGKRAVSGSMDKTLRVWDLKTGRCLRTLEGHTGWVTIVSITPDGKRAVSSGSNDRTLRVWDLECGRCLQTLEEHTDDVNSVSVTPDGKRAVSGSNDRTLRVWDLETGRCLRTLAGHASYVYSVSVTPDGKRAVSGSMDKTLRVWDLKTGRCLRILEGHTHDVRNVSVTPDGKRAVSGSMDKTLRVWDLESGRCLRTLEGHTKGVNSVSVTPDGKRAVSGSWDNTLRAWDLKTGRCLRILEGHTGWVNRVNSVSVTPDGKRVVSGSGSMFTMENNTLRVWDLETGRCLQTLEGHTDEVMSVSVMPDGKRAVSGSIDKTLRVWDLESGRCSAVYQASGHVESVSVQADGTVVTALGKEVVILSLRNICMKTPIISSASIWLYTESESDDQWEVVIEAAYQWCCQYFPVSYSTFNFILTVARKTGLAPDKLYTESEITGQWETDIRATCQWCGQRFPVSDNIRGLMKAIAGKTNLKPKQSLCENLSAEAWDEPGLLSECPLCHKPLKFNPFVVDDTREGTTNMVPIEQKRPSLGEQHPAFNLKECGEKDCIIKKAIGKFVRFCIATVFGYGVFRAGIVAFIAARIVYGSWGNAAVFYGLYVGMAASSILGLVPIYGNKLHYMFARSYLLPWAASHGVEATWLVSLSGLLAGVLGAMCPGVIVLLMFENAPRKVRRIVSAFGVAVFVIGAIYSGILFF